MSDEVAPPLTAEESKYFASKGAEAPPEATTNPPPSVSPPAAETPKADTPKAPEAAQETPEAEGKDNDGKFVRLAALKEEREKRKKLAAELQAERERIARMEGRFQEFTRQVAPQQEPAAAPTVDTDPVAVLREINQKVQRYEQQEGQRQQLQQFVQAYQSKANEFTGKQPDFPNAYNHFIAAKTAELQEYGWTDPAMVTNQVQQLEQAIVLKAFQDGVNPAERIYAAAKRLGYTQKAEQKPAEEAATKADVARAVETIAEGQKAAASLGQASGGAAPKLSLQALAEMDDDEFSRLDNKVWKRLMGG